MNELGLIIAVVGTGVGIIAVVITLFLWIRTEGNSDRRLHDQDIKELRKDLVDVLRSIDNEFKDFHIRLLRIEEGRSKPIA